MIELFHSSDAKPVIGNHRVFDGFVFFSEYAQRSRHDGFHHHRR
ncbi:hypothetical protein [Devosia sp. MC521]|nr:hypothetical protein [Devosia sp. MC521]